MTLVKSLHITIFTIPPLPIPPHTHTHTPPTDYRLWIRISQRQTWLTHDDKYLFDVFWLVYQWHEAGNAADSRWYCKISSRGIKPFSILECTVIPGRPGPASGRWKRWWKSCQWAPPESRSLASSPAWAQRNLPHCSSINLLQQSFNHLPK